MGGCCSCCCSDSGDAHAQSEMELQAQKARKALGISETMSAPTIVHKNPSQISGKGLALVGVPIEQDAAYWEWHMTAPAKMTIGSVLFGVTGKKDAKFYQDLKDKSPPDEGKYLCSITGLENDS